MLQKNENFVYFAQRRIVMTSIEKYSDRIFENIKQINEYGQEFWYARELMAVSRYSGSA